METLISLPLERTERLKTFGIVGINKDIPLDFIKNKITLSLVTTYNLVEAIIGAQEGIRQNLNLDPNNFIVPYLYLISESQIPPRPFITPITEPKKEEKEEKEEKEQKEQKTKKEKEDLVFYVKYMFDKVGTEEERKVAESVIDKFTHLDLLVEQ